ncbi:MAG: ABC transporter substrate-binding protein [Thermoplasmatales archaeon B_DKE]|nr:MAG: ABC transporter substrate-binding protein [Thermoplasmatales archaeon B_DKE]
MRKLLSCNGSEITLPDEVNRIISFSPSVTEILFQLGMEDRIVGISAFCARPEGTKKKRRVGSYGSARVEILDELKPDLILTISGYQKQFSDRISEKFPVYMFELPSTVAGIVDLVSRVGIVVNRNDEARKLSKDLLKAIPTGGGGRNLSGYLEIDLGGPVSFGSMSYITDALHLMGVESIYRNFNSEWLTPDERYIIENDPEIIFYEHKMYRDFPDNEMQKIIKERKWDKTSAGREGSIFPTPGTLDFFAHHGTSFITEVMPWAMRHIRECLE